MNWNPRGVVANVLDCGLEGSEFEFPLPYYVHFRTNKLGEGMNSLNIQAIGEIVLPTFFYKDNLALNNPQEVELPRNQVEKISPTWWVECSPMV